MAFGFLYGSGLSLDDSYPRETVDSIIENGVSYTFGNAVKFVLQQAFFGEELR